MAKQTVPLSRALIWIFLSTILVSGSATLAWLYLLRVQAKRVKDPQYTITHLAVETADNVHLPTDYFAEILGLSVDQSANLYRFQQDQARTLLEAHPLIRQAKLGIRPPHTVEIHYQMRQPRARLIDWENTGVDAEGKLFPLDPFYSQLELPELYLGIASPGLKPWAKRVQGDLFELAIELLDHLMEGKQRSWGEFKRIDVSKAYSDSLGKRQVVLELEDALGYRITLRINSSVPQRSLDAYEQLRPHLHAVLGDVSEGIVDLRIPGFGFLEKR